MEQSEDKIDIRVKVIRPANSLFLDALNYRPYRLINKDQTNNDNIAVTNLKEAEDVADPNEVPNFVLWNPISMIAFVKTFKTACKSIGILERVAVWLFH